MPSEQRLHPATLLFDLARHLRAFAFPAVLVFFGASQSSRGPGGSYGNLPAGWEVWLLVLLVPAVAASVTRYLTFRLRYEGRELVIRSGLLFRNVRHVPFAKVQNIDAVQNVVHRLFDVIEIRVETGGGKDEEARLSVLPRTALDEMRRRVFDGRVATTADAPSAAAVAAGPARSETLLHMPLREVLLCGFIENKGLVLIGASYGLAWETGLLNRLGDHLFGEQTYGRGLFRDLAQGISEGQGPPLQAVSVVVAGVAVLLLLVRIISMIWTFVRLYDFRLSRVDEDLRIGFGLLTRVAATIPLRRVQTVTIRQGPLHRWFRRASVRVETAGGTGANQEWLAPLIHLHALKGLLDQIVPGFDPGTAAWQRVHPGAFRRAVKPRLAAAAVITLGWALAVGYGTLAVLLLTTAGAILLTRQYLKHLHWAETEDGVLLRSGWLWRQTTLARANRIQSVTFRQTPFDRRFAMARVRVDTAGARATSHRVDIPYLDRGVATGLADRLSIRAASTTFKW